MEMLAAIAREQRIKAGSQQKTLALIEGMTLRRAVLYPNIL